MTRQNALETLRALCPRHVRCRRGYQSCKAGSFPQNLQHWLLSRNLNSQPHFHIVAQQANRLRRPSSSITNRFTSISLHKHAQHVCTERHTGKDLGGRSPTWPGLRVYTRRCDALSGRILQSSNHRCYSVIVAHSNFGKMCCLFSPGRSMTTSLSRITSCGETEMPPCLP